MRIEKLWLDGYGRFSGKDLEVAPGFQIIVGPNEQGKSTVRNFIGDMLYGQKKNAAQADHDDGYELRRPWRHPDKYCGRLLYRLDDGREIEVQRNFDERHEVVRIFDHTNNREITADFPRLRNREPMFAEQHLGVPKAVFLHTATINHFTLENLGDAGALSQIREKLLSLADSAEVAGSADTALTVIEGRIAQIGRPTAKSRPLPAARARLNELEREKGRVEIVCRELSDLEYHRQELRRALADARQRRTTIDDKLRVLDKADRRKRLNEAEALHVEIDEVTQTCFALSAYRDFPLEREGDLQRGANVVATARTQLERTLSERAQLQREYELERERLGPLADIEIKSVPEDMERKLVEMERQIGETRARLEQLQIERNASAERHASAREDLENLPDFSHLADDPIAWLTRIVSDYRVVAQSRDKDQSKLERVQDQVAAIEERLAKPEGIFSAFEDFKSEAEAYEEDQRHVADQRMEILTRIDRFRIDAEEHEDFISQMRMLAIIVGVVFVACLVALLFNFDNLGIKIALGCAALFLLISLLWLLTSRLKSAEARNKLVEAESRLNKLDSNLGERRERIAEAVKRAGYDTVRELEALFERYEHDRAELAILLRQMDEQQQAANDTIEQAQLEFTRLQEHFAAAGAPIASEDDIPVAMSQGIARYQEYRDAKRRASENRDKPAGFDSQIASAREDLEILEMEERDVALTARRIMRESGFREEATFTSALSAVRNYQLRCAQLREKRGRIDLLQEQIQALDRQIEREEQELEMEDDRLKTCLEEAGAESIEQWRERAEKAREYSAAWSRRQNLQQQLDSALRGDDLDTLRREARDNGGDVVAVTQHPGDLKIERDLLSAEVDDLTQQEHELHIVITEKQAASRTLNEIEEEEAELERRIESLDFELRAAAYAAAVIEEVARDRHARIAPRLASLASGYLSDITGGAYKELNISRDLRITIRIPETSMADEDPQQRLSQGTVDQVYFALRMALIQGMSEAGESIPMLLDDPFSNYDDLRLARSMRLLSNMAGRCQILLFTCRDDVVRAAQNVNAPILEL